MIQPGITNEQGREILAAARAGARRSLRGHPPEDVEDAAASAVLAVMTALARGHGARSAARLATVVGRRRGHDLRRACRARAARQARLAADPAAWAAQPTLPGLIDVEWRLDAGAALQAALRAHARRPTREMGAVASMLARVLAGRSVPDLPPSGQRRLARGVLRLRRALAGA